MSPNCKVCGAHRQYENLFTCDSICLRASMHNRTRGEQIEAELKAFCAQPIQVDSLTIDDLVNDCDEKRPYNVLGNKYTDW
jgi:hypothetical protein